MLDWLGKMLQLPAEFLACSGGKGGGVIQGTASEATLVALLGAKAKMMKKVKEEHPDWDDAVIIPKLVGYCSSKQTKIHFLTKFIEAFKQYFLLICSSGQAHSSVERAGLLGGVRLRSVPADEDNQMRGEILEQFIREDLDKGLIPFYVSSCHFSVFFPFQNKT